MVELFSITFFLIGQKCKFFGSYGFATKKGCDEKLFFSVADYFDFLNAMRDDAFIAKLKKNYIIEFEFKTSFLDTF